MYKMRHILFIGGFSLLKNGTIGGTAFACRSLVSGPLSERIKWIKLDYTMKSLPPPFIGIRLIHALKRMGKYLNYLINEKLDCILIFSSTGLSFLEKGLMAKIGSLVGIPVYFCPRSGNMNKLMDSSYFFRSFAQWVFRGCEQVVCQSDSWRVYYQEVTSLPDEQFTVIPNWIDTSRYPGKQFTGGESRL